jgi:hypothetical protein
MVDPRIYRAGLALVAIAVIVFGFSLEGPPAPEATNMTPPAWSITRTELQDLAQTRTRDDATGPRAFAAYVAGRLAHAVDTGGSDNFKVSTAQVNAPTASGARAVEFVTASRIGLDSGTIAVVSDRDAPGVAGVSGTAVLIALAHALAGETQNHSIMLISSDAEVGSAGATALARTLAGAGQPIEAVLVLGDLAAAHPSNPLVSPFSNVEAVAPPVLTLTALHYLQSQTGLGGGGASLGAQLAHLAIPLTLTGQGPFAANGIPAVLVSLAGDRTSVPGEAINANRPAEVFAAIAQTLDALDANPPVPGPSAYLVLSGKLVPLWAVRLLVLILILPVALATIDALARTRRRGHSLSRWVAWALAGSIPFLLAVAVVRLAQLAGLLSAPPGVVGPGAAPLTGAGIGVLAAAAIAWIAGVAFVRPFCIKLALERLGRHDGRRPASAAGDAAAVAVSLVLSVTALIVWALNPFAAVLLVPALHLWLWLAQPGVRARRPLVALLVVVGALPAVVLVGYYAHSFGLLAPVKLAWSATLLVAGGGLPLVATVYWSFVLGSFVSVVILGIRASRSAATLARVEPVVTVRGPIGYAGPGSLGGTESALRR